MKLPSQQSAECRQVRNLAKPSAVSVALGIGTLLLTPAVSTLAAERAAEDKTSDALEEIIVTAEFRKANLQTTPLAITAFSGDNLEDRSLSNVAQLSAFVPNASIQPLSAGYGSTLAAYVRGVGLQDNSLSFEPGVPIYIDDVYNGRPQAAIFDLLDIEQIEVLRGPQGTLFGKNAIGGAVRIASKKPQGDGSGYFSYTAGSFRRNEMRGAFDVSIIPDKLMLRVAASSKKKDGYGDVLDYTCVTGVAITGIPSQAGRTDGRNCVVGHEGGIDDQAARVALRWVATDTVEVNLVGDYTKQNDEGPVSKFLQINSTPSNGLVSGWNGTVSIPTYGVGLGNQFLTSGKYSNYSTYSDSLTGRYYPDVSIVDHWGLANTIEFSPSESFHVKSITAYRRFTNTFGRNSDGSPLPFNRTWNDTRHRQFSQELQFTGTIGNLDWATGAYYYDAEDSDRGFTVLLPNFPFAPISTDNYDVLTTRDYAAFVHGIYKFTDQFSVTAGLRYTKDEKLAVLNRVACCGPFNGLVTIPGTHVTADSRRTSPLVNVSYQLTPDLMTYVQYATGFRGGGFAPRPSSSAQVASFEPEDLDNYELGVKSQWLDHRVTLNGAVFYEDYTNQQQPFQTTLNGAPWFRTINTGKSRIWGVEGELQARPVQEMMVQASFGYLNYYRTDVGLSGLCQELADGTTCYPPHTPKWNGALGVQYDFSLGAAGTITPRVDANYTSAMFFVNNNKVGQGGYTLVNARLGWESADEAWSAAVFVTNLTDKYYFNHMLSLEGVLGFNQGNPAAPREWGVTLKRKF